MTKEEKNNSENLQKGGSVMFCLEAQTPHANTATKDSEIKTDPKGVIDV
jgi:hypothetical protein